MQLELIINNGKVKGFALGGGGRGSTRPEELKLEAFPVVQCIPLLHIFHDKM